MEDKLVYAKIKEQFVKRGLYEKLAPVGVQYLTEEKPYGERLEEALPDIYRELKQNGALPDGITYDLFIRECQWGMEVAKAKYSYGPNVQVRR